MQSRAQVLFALSLVIGLVAGSAMSVSAAPQTSYYASVDQMLTATVTSTVPPVWDCPAPAPGGAGYVCPPRPKLPPPPPRLPFPWPWPKP